MFRAMNFQKFMAGRVQIQRSRSSSTVSRLGCSNIPCLSIIQRSLSDKHSIKFKYKEILLSISKGLLTCVKNILRVHYAFIFSLLICMLLES